MEIKQSCTICAYAIFDSLLGEFKCSKKERYCTEDEINNNACDLYNPGKPSTSKERRDYEDDIQKEL